MKKLITLLILFVGMVSTVSAKVIYIQDTWNFKNENKKDFCVHMWGGSTETSFPGVYLIQGGVIKVETAIVSNETNDNQRYYKVDLGNNTSFNVNNNNGNEPTEPIEPEPVPTANFWQTLLNNPLLLISGGILTFGLLAFIIFLLMRRRREDD